MVRPKEEEMALEITQEEFMSPEQFLAV